MFGKKKTVRLITEFKLKYTANVYQGEKYMAETKGEAIVLAESREQAIERLQETLKKEYNFKFICE